MKFTLDPTGDAVLEAACRVVNVDRGQLQSKSRVQSLVTARAAAAYYLRHLHYTWTEIATALGYKDHSSAMHVAGLAHDAVEEPGVDPRLYRTINIVGETLGMGDRLFRALLDEEGIPQPEAEWEFHHTRKWRLDYCWTDYWVALEVEGGAFIYGRHNRPSGFLADKDKYNAWALEGGLLIYTTPKTLCTMATVRLISEALATASDLRGLDYTRGKKS